MLQKSGVFSRLSVGKGNPWIFAYLKESYSYPYMDPKGKENLSHGIKLQENRCRPGPIDQGSHASLRIVFNLADLSVAWLKRQQPYHWFFRNPTNQLKHYKGVVAMPEDGWMNGNCKLQSKLQVITLLVHKFCGTLTKENWVRWLCGIFLSFDRWTSEGIQHIQQIFVGVVFLGPNVKQHVGAPNTDHIWCVCRGQSWSFTPTLSLGFLEGLRSVSLFFLLKWT